MPGGIGLPLLWASLAPGHPQAQSSPLCGQYLSTPDHTLFQGGDHGHGHLCVPDAQLGAWHGGHMGAGWLHHWDTQGRPEFN